MRQAKRNSFHNYFKVPKQSFLSLCLCCICPMGAALIENAAANWVGHLAGVLPLVSPPPPCPCSLSALSRCLDKSLDSTYLSRLIGQTGRQTKRSCARFKIDRSIESSTPLSSGSPRLACRICILWQLQLGSSCNNICSFNLTSAAIATQSRTWKTSDDKRRVVNKNCAERETEWDREEGEGVSLQTSTGYRVYDGCWQPSNLLQAAQDKSNSRHKRRLDSLRSSELRLPDFDSSSDSEGKRMRNDCYYFNIIYKMHVLHTTYRVYATVVSPASAGTVALGCENG